MSKPKILVARAIFPEVIAKLEQHFEVEHNQADVPWSKQQLAEKLKDKVGVFTPGGERMNVGGSPGDGYLPEPYLYVGPRSAARPGDPAYWNAPFGAALTFTELRATDRPADAALEFLLRGAELLANG